MKKWNNRSVFIVLILSTFLLNVLYANNNLTQSQVFDEFKKVMSTDNYLDNYDVDYGEFLEVLKPKQKKLATEIFNENIEDFNKLLITPKTQVYNAILYWLATLASPKDFEWKIATEKLSWVVSSWISIHWKLSELISFFRQHWEEFQKISDEYWEQLEQKLKDINIKLNKAKEWYSKAKERWKQLDIELRKEQERWKQLDIELRKENKQLEMLKALDRLLK